MWERGSAGARPSRARGTPRRLVVALAAVGWIPLAAGAWIAWPLPDDVRRAEAPAGASVTLTDRSGVVLRTTRAADGSRVRWMPMLALDPDLLAAFVAVEDRRFFEHHGIDWRASARAARDNLLAGRIVSVRRRSPCSSPGSSGPRRAAGRARRARRCGRCASRPTSPSRRYSSGI